MCFCVFLLQVLFRLNFLVLVLCVVMDRPYQFYYFVPLVTFWFVVIYGTLAMWPQILQKKANSRCQRAFNCICFTHLQTTKKKPPSPDQLRHTVCATQNMWHLSSRSAGGFSIQRISYPWAVALWTGSGMWHIGVLVKLLGLLLFICFFAFSQVGQFESLWSHQSQL